MHDRLAPPVRHALVGYGIRLLAARLGQPLPADGPLAAWLSGPEPAELAWARRQLDDDEPLSRPIAPRPLRTVSSLLALDDERKLKPPPSFVPLRPRDLPLDTPEKEDWTPAALWAEFAERAARLRAGAGLLESFAALLARYGSCVPGPLLTPGVSVYEQFRATAALAATLPPPTTQVLLVEGDLSGIQEMLYTITSKGAAKNLRGRSLYLQLLGDALARVILRALELPAICLFANAGGGFRLLARASDTEALERLRRTLNRRLLRLHGGELALALAWAPVRSTDLAGDGFSEAARLVAEGLDEQKTRSFAELTVEQAAQPTGSGAEPRAIGVIGSGSDFFCEICHVDLPDERFLAKNGGQAPTLRCSQCDSFGERAANRRSGQQLGPGLARLLADCAEHKAISVRVDPLPDEAGVARRAGGAADAWYGRPSWDAALAALGVTYRFGERATPAPGLTYLALNYTDCLPEQPDPDCAYGFRFLALTTPRVTERGPDLERLKAFFAPPAQRDPARPERGQVDYTSREAPPLEEAPEEVEAGAIRTLTLTARWDSNGVDRYGALRMDIDDLGRLLHHRLEIRSLPHSAALSADLSHFFEGWLNTICEQVAGQWSDQVATITNVAAWRRRMADRTGVPFADEQQAPAAGEPQPGPANGPRSKLPYVIYAGGDDLLVLGPWDVLPPLAARIRRDLSSYALRGRVSADALPGPAPLTVSAGIVAASAYFPLYQAADQAGDALKAAKKRKLRRVVPGAGEGVVVRYTASPDGGDPLWTPTGPPPVEWVTVKDAISFLGVTVSWDEFDQAEELAHKLARMIDLGVQGEGRPQPDRAPHALIQLLAGVARSYAESGGERSADRLAYGRWMPQLAYGLHRMAERVPAGNSALRRAILGLAGETLDLTRVSGATQWHTLRFLSLPVRWAQLLIRTGG